ncbi:MAG TPA: prepilin peptidase [Anaeromyxobacteraceae bacterium]|jgi:prepilin peptidase CpaA|nr:prepilin peptidase [Anaeromyxobacteraceae bacterium]
MQVELIMIAFLPIVLAVVLLLVGAAWDLLRRRVPNAVSGGVLLAGIGAQFAKGPREAALAILAGFLVGIVLSLLWAARLVGGGDVKLAVAAAVCVGWFRVPVYLLATALAGGVASLVCYFASSPEARSRVRSNLTAVALGLGSVGVSPDRKMVPVPYGVAIAAGALTVLWRS